MADVVLAKMAIQIAADTSKMVSGLNAGQKSLDKFTKSFASTAKGLVAGFAFAKIGSDIIDVTAQFQKFEAVLSNTLGSESAAQQALQQIKQFASETPFAVDELTGAFVKLANQGFTPTTNELRSLGDLASSTGKSFDQLAEAIIDAQTGEFERLKEFGIRAQKQGDQVKFTFKGVQTQVAFTSDAIRNYVLSLGNAVGVSGAMEKISGTLGGRISNLGDAWDNLLVTIGKGNSGVLFRTVQLFTSLANFSTDLFGGDSNPLQTLESGIRILNESGLEGERYADALKEVQKSAELLGIKLIKLTDNATGLSKVMIDTRSKPTFIDSDSIQKQVESLDTLQKKLKDLNTQFESTDKNDTKKLSNIGSEIISTQALIAELEKLRKKQEDVFAKRKIAGAKVLLEFSQSDIVKTIADAATAFKAAAKQHEDDFKIVVKIDDNQLTKLPQKIIDIGPVLKKAVEQAKLGLAGLGEFTAEAEKIMIDASGAVSSGIASIADALGTALGSGDFKDFGKNILEAVAGFAQQLGSLMIATGIAEAALQFSGNPYVIAAAGVALVAAGAAIKALQSKKSTLVSGAGGSGGGGGLSSGRPSGTTVSGAQNSMQIEVVGILKGQDIWLSGSNYEKANRYLKPNG